MRQPAWAVMADAPASRSTGTTLQDVWLVVAVFVSALPPPLPLVFRILLVATCWSGCFGLLYVHLFKLVGANPLSLSLFVSVHVWLVVAVFVSALPPPLPLVFRILLVATCWSGCFGLLYVHLF